MTLVKSATQSYTANVVNFSYAFYNLDNLTAPNDPKPIFFTANTPFVKSFTPPAATASASVPVTFAEIDRPDLNAGGVKPTHIQVNAYFTDAAGNVSAASSALRLAGSDFSSGSASRTVAIAG